MLLAGDIGGTKTSLAIYTQEAGLHAPLAEATLPSRRYDSLERLVADFLRHTNLPFDQAVFGVAGPVVGGRAEVTNLPWLLEEHALAESLSVEVVHLMNDLESIANAVPFMAEQDIATIRPGKAVSGGPIGVVAPGTGLGEAFLIWDGQGYRAQPSEGGHTSFAPTNDEQMAMLQHLRQRFAHVSYERVCSGMGIPNLYNFFKESGRYPEPDWLAAALAESDDPTPIIIQSGLSRPDEAPICAHVLKLFVDILGAECGNLALTVMATGGVYVGGGIPPRILAQLTDGRFEQAFLDKGRFAELLKNVPVQVILNPKAALLGAASYGLHRM
jgi:glucokinase